MTAVSSVPSPGQVDVADTSGTSIWDLDLDTSGGLSSGVVDPLASTAWEAYRALVALTVWTLDQAIALSWAPYVLAPLAGVARATRYAVAAVNPLALMLIVLALVVGVAWVRGRYARGAINLAVGCLTAAAATTVLADPFTSFTEPGGLLFGAAAAGADIATGLLTGGHVWHAPGGPGGAMPDGGVVGPLVDVLVTEPHRYLSGSAPAEVFSTVSAFLLPTAVALLVFTTVVTLVQVIATVGIAVAGIGLLILLPLGVLPGQFRAGAVKTLLLGLGSAVAVTVTTAFTAGWAVFLQGWFDQTDRDGVPWLVRFPLTSLILLSGAVLLWHTRTRISKSLRTVADRIAEHARDAVPPTPSMAMPPAARTGIDYWRAREAGARERMAVPVGPDAGITVPTPSIIDTATTRRTSRPENVAVALGMTGPDAPAQRPQSKTSVKLRATLDAARSDGSTAAPDGVLALSSTERTHRKLLRKPPANATIVVDKRFTYRTDDDGRVVHSATTLTVVDTDAPRSDSAQRGLLGKLRGDHAGHLFARIFQGPPQRVNLVPMLGSKVNLGSYKKLENKWRAAIDAGKSVEVSIDLVYPTEARRPERLRVVYKVEGEKQKRSIIRNLPPSDTVDETVEKKE